MQFKTLGRSDLAVTDICLGAMTWGSQNDEADLELSADVLAEIDAIHRANPRPF